MVNGTSLVVGGQDSFLFGGPHFKDDFNSVLSS
jgi:hypothetical protein